jgi:hypothetical protein
MTMRHSHLFYWTTTGALMGYGAVGILSDGFPFLFVGAGLLIYGLIRRWFGGLWAFLIGFGVVPAILLVLDILTAPATCFQGKPPISTHTTMGLACGGPIALYWLLALVFAAVALGGVLAGPWRPHLGQVLRVAAAPFARDAKGRAN